jgi:hypothetical protein
VPFRLVVSGSEATADVVEAFAAFGREQRQVDSALIRQYAIDRLDWRHKAGAFGVAP